MCTVAMLIVLAGLPKGSMVVVPATALQGYAKAEIEQAQGCARSRGIKWRVAWDK